MDPYSPTLAVGLAASFGALASVATATLVRARGGDASRFRRLGGILATLGAIALVLAGASHLVLGHRPGTPQGLGPLAFFLSHPALLVGATATVVALTLRRYAAALGSSHGNDR